MRDIHDSRHIPGRVCGKHSIERRLAQANHPCANGQVKRMNRSLKALRGLTPHEFTCQAWTQVGFGPIRLQSAARA